MGDYNSDIEHHHNVLHFNHTNNNVEFFSEITHYFYPTSSYFVDPFPHSVLEAVQTGKTIIFPHIERDFKDGIDELKDVIRWKESFDHREYPNDDHPLKAEIWSKFYQRVFDSNFEFEFDRREIKSFDHFIERYVI